ncbi:MAG: site-specific DNA-methyltransferase [Candidatus Omnitrophota bacterium]|jgi:site-specific DNA-methyltransferase (adenine-specific)
MTIERFKNKILTGDARKILRELPNESVDCVVTSPPYWALRDYGTQPLVWDGDKNCRHEWETAKRKWHSDRGSNKRKEVFSDDFQVDGTVHDTCKKCSAWRGSLGQEARMELFIKHLCDIFDEIKRVLKNAGTCWVNIGDTYSATRWTGEGKGQSMNKFRDGHRDIAIKKLTDLGDKCLCQIPSRFALEMTNRGWILRNEIIWHKPNCMPSSVKDRFTVDFEKLYFFTKNQKYFFEQQFDKANYDGRKDTLMKGSMKYSQAVMPGRKPHTMALRGHERWQKDANGNRVRNKRCVWTINTRPFKDAHFATFPAELIETPIVAGCPRGGLVLDPFIGSGTTAAVARDFDMDFIGIELNPEYVKIAEKRIAALPQTLFSRSVSPEAPGRKA